MKIEQMQWSDYHKAQPVLVTLCATGSDFSCLAVGGLFWNLQPMVREWLDSNCENYEIRYNDVHSDLPEVQRVITHKLYIIFYGDAGYSPMSQALMFKLRWSGV